jgi:hypothetical protein
VAALVFDAVREGRFYIYSHPKSLASGADAHGRHDAGRNPTDPFADRPEIGEGLRAALRATD